MHRQNRTRRAALRCLLLGLALGTAVFSSASSFGQAPAPAEAAGAPLGQPQNIVLPLGGSQRVQLTSKKPIVQAASQNERIARVMAVAGDPTTILVVADPQNAGITTITLIADDKSQESFQVTVQFDVEYLRTLLQRVVPTAVINPIPGANNSVILTGHVSRAEDVEIAINTATANLGQGRVINALRVGGVQQVQLDVVVALVARNEARRLAVEFINNGRQHVLANAFANVQIPSQGLEGTFPGSPEIRNFIGRGVNGAPSNIFAAVFTPKQDFFSFIQALSDENIVKLLAEPRLVAMSGRFASFLSGGEQAIPVPAGLGQVGVQFEEFGTRLNFLPIVLGNGRIYLEVEPEVSSLNPAFGSVIQGTAVPGRDTQRLRTTVELEPGQTFALGGLIFRNVTGNTRKVPFLGDLPFLGAAFRSVFYNETETELLVLVTPHLVDALGCDQVPKHVPGQESRTPDDFELFLEGILEAPRGSREVCPGKRYTPAFKGAPNIGQIPCENGGCNANANSSSVPTQPHAPAPLPAAPAVQATRNPSAELPTLLPATGEVNAVPVSGSDPVTPTPADATSTSTAPAALPPGPGDPAGKEENK